jgi:hypothetical protein
MKIYLVKRKQTNIRWFDNEIELTQFLTTEKNKGERISDYTVTSLDATLDSSCSGEEILSQVSNQIELDTKLNSVLGDEYSQKVCEFIELFNKLARDIPSKRKIQTILNSTPANKTEFSKVIKRHSDYFLYNVSSSVEWYQSLLSIYGFKKLGVTCTMEYYDPVTRGSRWTGCRTPEIMTKNFNKAKLNVQ